MATKKPARPTAKKAKPSKPPKGTGGGGAESDSGASLNMDSGEGNFSALDSPNEAKSQAKREADFLADWKARKEKLRAARDALWKLPASEYESIIREVIHTAPSAWHLRKLIQEVVRHLQWLSRGRGDHRLGIPENDEGVIGRVHYQLAPIAREFNVSLTAKSTPQWLLVAKKHPEFQKAWSSLKRTKGTHEKELLEQRVIEVARDDRITIRATFGKNKVQTECIREGKIVWTESRDRLSSSAVLQAWVNGTLTEFDKNCDHAGSPLSYDWATRWADEEKYLKHFMIWAESAWNEEGVDSIQIGGMWGSGLLTSNSGGKKSAGPRYDFAAFQTRIKGLAKRQLRVWRDEIVPPAPKVSRV